MGYQTTAAQMLRGQLEPLQPYLDRTDVYEVVINRPGEVWVETRSGWRSEQLPALSLETLRRLAVTTANFTGQSIDEVHPLLSATLPGGERVQIVIPPAVTVGTVSVTIRKPSCISWSLGELARTKLFDHVAVNVDPTLETREQVELSNVLYRQDVPTFLALAVRQKQNIIIAGATGSGKTTLAKALIQLIPNHERIITIEDTLELEIPQPNHVRLLYSKGGQGVSHVQAKDLLESCLRMRPDRIMLQELRDGTAFDYLRNVSSGHPGSITTVHANSCALAFEQLTLLVKQSDAGRGLDRSDIRALLEQLVDVVVQCKRVDGEFRVTEIWFGGDAKRVADFTQRNITMNIIWTAAASAVAIALVCPGVALAQSVGGGSATGSGALAVGTGATATGQYDAAFGHLATASGGVSTSVGAYADASGQNSTAVGQGAIASGVLTTSVGQASIATGDYSSAFGRGATADALASTALGTGAAAAAVASTAVGQGSVASGVQATAIGQTAAANGSHSVAVGALSSAGLQATAIGNGSLASTLNATALGQAASATGENATALGRGAQSTGVNSVALGQGSVDAGRANTVSVGSIGGTRTVSNVATGTLGTDAVNLDQLNGVAALSNATQGQVTMLQNQVGTLETQQTGTASTVATQGGQIGTLQTQQAATGATVAEQTGQIASLNGRTTTVEGTVAGLQTTLAASQATITTHSGQITALQGQQAHTAATVASQGGQIAALGGRQTTTEANVATMQSQQATTTATVTTHTGQIASLNTTVAAHGSQIAAATTTANSALQRSGGTMTGGLNMGGHVISGAGPAINADDLITKGQVDVGFAGVNSRINGVERDVTRAKQGVASSMAMSGVSMPAGKKFTLGGHVASFDGQQALGFSAGAMVAKNVMIDAGVGFSTNGGPAGVRLGGQVAW